MSEPKKARIYDHPRYYEIAFSFRDICNEIDILEWCMKDFSRIPVRTVLELGCGPASHMAELMNRGYEYIGIDLSDKMLEFGRERAEQAGLSPVLLKEDMVRFTIGRQVDFAFVLVGSLYATNTADLFSHFESVAAALCRGGIYFLDWCVEFDRSAENFTSWEIERNGVRTETSYSCRYVDLAEQTIEERIRIKVRDHGGKLELEERNTIRAVHPREFVSLIEKSGSFEFVGWWNNWNLNEPISESGTIAEHKKIERPITVIRRV